MFKWIKSRLSIQDDERLLLQQADDARKVGDLDRARRNCVAVLRDSPDNVRALSLMAAIAADEHQFEAGLQWARKAIAADPQSVAAHYAMGRLWEGAERYTEAEACYRRVTLIDPGHARAHNNLGCMLHMQGRLQEALACYGRALQLDPDQPEAIRNYAAITGDAVELVTAINGFLGQIAQNPSDAVAYQSLANIYAQQGRHDEALMNFERAIALAPDRAEFHFAKAELLLVLGDYANGWTEYAWRWRMNAFNDPVRRFPQPVWDDRPTKDGTLPIPVPTGLA